MKTDYTTKSMSRKGSDEPSTLAEFNFPQHGITVEAESMEEAQEKLQKLLKAKELTQE